MRVDGLTVEIFGVRPARLNNLVDTLAIRLIVQKLRVTLIRLTL